MIEAYKRAEVEGIQKGKWKQNKVRKAKGLRGRSKRKTEKN